MKQFAFVLALVATCVVSGPAFGQGSDDCATAELIVGLTAGGTVSVAVDTTLATTDLNNPFDASVCGAGIGDCENDVWFTFEAPADGVMSFSTCGTTPAPLDTDIYIYEADPSLCGAGLGPLQLACAGDSCAGFGSIVENMPVTAASFYLIRIGGWDASVAGATTLDITHFASLPAINVTCTDNGDPNNPLADVEFELQPPVNGTEYDEVRIYVGGTLSQTLPGPLPAGPQLVPGISITAGAANQICVETVTGGLLSPQECCGAFVALPCPASANPPMSPLATLAPYTGNVACGTAANTAENRYFKSFDLINQYGVADEIELTCFGTLLDFVQSPAGSHAARVRLHYDLTGGAPSDLANLVLFYEEEFEVPNLADEPFNFVFGTGIVDPDLLGLNATPVIGCLQAQGPGATLVVEYLNVDDPNDAELFFTSSSDASVATGNSVIDETYLMSPPCGINAPITFASLGFANTLIPFDLTYDTLVAGSCSGGGGVANLACTQTSGQTTFDLQWVDAGFASSVVIEVDGNVEATLPVPGPTTFTTSALTPYIDTVITVTAFTGAGGTGTVVNSRSCTAEVSPENNWLAGATAITPGAYPYEIVTPEVTVQGPAIDTAVCDWDPLGIVGGDLQLWNDLYYTFTATVTGEVLVSTCSGGTGDTRLAIYTGTSNAAADVIACNDDRISGYVTPTASNPNVYNPACTNFAAELTFAATAGSTYTVRIGTFNAAGLVNGGELTLNDCVPVADLDYSMDCTNGDVTLTWADNPAATSISIFRDGVNIASPALGTTMYVDAAVSDGDHLYEVVIDCGSGPNAAGINASVLTYTGQTDLVFGMEGLQSEPRGLVGEIDSAPAIRDALANNGRSVGMVRSSFVDYPCLDSVQNVWVALGTNTDAAIFGAGILGPNITTVGNAYIMSATENDYLGNLAADVNVYLEGADHWAFDHQPGLFDTRDGIDDTFIAGPGFVAAFDGDDSFNVMDGINGGFGIDLSSFVDTVYTQDDSVDDDFTDQLPVGTNDAFGPNAAAIAQLDDQTATNLGIAQYNVMVHYDTNAGGKAVSSSVEFGGLGDAPTRDSIAAAILAGFPGGGGEQFFRGELNGDGSVNIADAIALLANLFPQPGNGPGPITCDDAADCNDDGAKNIADAVFLLSTLFPPPGGPLPTLPAPNGSCGEDPTADGLDCPAFPACP